MPVSKMTPEETREWLGGGPILPATKKTRPAPASVPPDPDQDAHGRGLASLSLERRQAMLGGWGTWLVHGCRTRSPRPRPGRTEDEL